MGIKPNGKEEVFNGKVNVYDYDIEKTSITEIDLIYHITQNLLDTINKKSKLTDNDDLRILFKFNGIRNNEIIEKYTQIYKYDKKGEPLYNYEKLKYELKRLIANKYEDLYLHNIRIGIFEKSIKGGCNTINSTTRKITINKKMKYAIYSPKSNNNNCLIGCFMSALKIKGNKLYALS